MDFWKTPPRAKVFEALTAVADGRVEMTGPTSARVVSSSGTKAYEVTWTADFAGFSSNDNASYWRGYIGYPILAVMLAVGVIEYSKQVAASLRGIPWKVLNQKFKNYDAAVDAVLLEVEQRGTSKQPLVDEVDRIFAQVTGLKLLKLPMKGTPPEDRVPDGAQGK